MYALKELENGFVYLEVKNEAAHAKIALQGAHIFKYENYNGELLWLSQISRFETGSAIRGGIPLCWPRFGNLDETLPQHGFARTMIFELIEVKEVSNSLTQVHLRLEDTPKSRKIWNFAFELDVVFEISATLSISMKTTNRDTKEFLLTQAFHTYFQVDDIVKVRIEGLEGMKYLDTLSDTKAVEDQPIEIDKEIDRVYLGVKEDIHLREEHKNISIHAENSNSAIVWNPWAEKCSNMSAMKPDAYKEFVCIESANAFDDFRIVQPNENVHLRATYLTQRC
ncbi:D-hexose-6-phosphate mutarotase [Sulfurimonas paralvinellae]|uniref:Putative glucose-6-phosphate 1-epimerase n=1 Tax=Sulfurimonas paralvinellae TaxID=317658 RepID=A0A7M1B588_9BACT|nr:D-hexose-6-phosphate mutarotase [Sulfurimonas paralvinellae]QOP44894.1 D-hexose-6-phosphate mutarotase [Sulfurimonas paralvinellae]